MHIEMPPRRQHSISLTPLIDVVFILLIFFMLASSLIDWRGITLATGSAPAPADTPPAATVGVTRDGSLRYAGGIHPDVDAIAEKLRQRLAAGEISAVIVDPDPGVTLGPTVAAFDALAGAGIQALALARE